ncbi:hypothetical protein EX895_003546 [Sporisorium graminicola]|uniref:Uncharacterized protein n=1 Tax=Sporisorium graminicola TaxID=280036 RepID=A0A4U7KXG0_9BASI|nr:hypothetical protein EX895_003546 [Sporisorium graminicola]TKY87532.1 hypothetical protein EX895_003546 [Sporisorium graminicola]
MTRISTSALFALGLVLVALCADPALAQQGAPPYTTDNGQSACVQYGSCSTAGGNGVVTASQNAPVTKPAGTPALATYTTLDSSYLSSLAAAGASAAYTGGSVNSARPVTRTSTVGGSASTRGSGSGGSSASSGSGGSGGSSSTGLGSLGSSSGDNAMSLNGALVQWFALSSAAVVGAALLL